MKWALKFATKGKKDGGGGLPAGSNAGGGKSVGINNIINNNTGLNGERVELRSSEEEEEDSDERIVEEEEGLEGTPVVTPPDNNNTSNGDSGADLRRSNHNLEQEEAAEKEKRYGVAEAGGGHSAPPYTVDNGEEDEWGEMEDRGAADGRRGGAVGDGERQDDVFDDDSQEDADSVVVSKTARIRSFADDPEGHVLEDADADGWGGSGAKDGSGGGGDGDGGQRGSPRASRGDDRSGTGGAGSHSYHSETRSGDNAAGTEEYNSNASPDHPGGGKSNTYTSFGGLSGGGLSVGQSESDMQGVRVDEEDEEDEAEDEDLDEDEDEDENDRYHNNQRTATGLGNNGMSNNNAGGDPDGLYGDSNNHDGGMSGGVGMGGGPMRPRARDQADAERRANAHAYADELDDMSREAPGYAAPGRGPYGSGGAIAVDRQRPSSSAVLPPPPPQGSAVPGVPGVNGLSAVDARTAAALAARTRLAAGGTAVGATVGGTAQRPEAGPVSAAEQAAVAAAAALRRGPTPGSHSLPSMVLVPLEALKAHRRVPRSSDRRALVRYRDLPDRSRSFVVFVSHAWMRPHTTPSFAHPDTSSRGGEKYRLIAEAGDRIRAHLPPDVRVLLWIDYSCVDQDSTRRSKATMRGMREYMRRCDAILTVYPGEAADNGEEFLPNRFVKSCSWAGSYKSLAHYCTRGWCRLEMLLGQTEPLPQDGFMFNFLVPKKKKASGAKASVGDRPHFLYGAHQRPHNGRIDVVPRQSSRWFEEHHPEQGNFTHESDRDAIRAVLAKQTSTMAKKTAAIAARYGTDPRRGGGGNSSSSAAAAAAAAARHAQNPDPSQPQFSGEYGRPH